MTPADKEVVEQFVAWLRREILAEMSRRSHCAPLTPPSLIVGGDAAWGERAAVLQDDSASFASRWFRELNLRTPFVTNWHVVAAKLVVVREGRIRRLVINLPPRHLKSLLASVACARQLR